MPIRLPRRRRAFPLRLVAVLALGALVANGCALELNPTALPTRPIQLATALGSISFNDMVYDARLGRLIVPAAETGQVALIDPATSAVTYLPGYSLPDPAADPANPPPAGAISAAVAHDLIYALDAGTNSLVVANPATGKIIGSVALQSAPDYVRYVAATNEIWVTERSAEQIEVFKFPDRGAQIPVSDGLIPIDYGAESLVIDRMKGLAYTNQPTLGETAVIQVQTRGILQHWGNGCSKARGMAMDEERGILFVACKEGKVVMIDTTNGGLQITSANYGGGLDDIGYNARLRHLYVASSTSGILAIFGVDLAPVPTAAPGSTATPLPTPTPASGPTPRPTPVKLVLTLLGTADTGVGDNRMTIDDRNNIWVGDPSTGRVLLVQDTFSPSGEGW